MGRDVGATVAYADRRPHAGIIPVGAKVKIVGNRNSDLKKFEIKTVRVTYDGKNYDVYPDRT